MVVRCGCPWHVLGASWRAYVSAFWLPLVQPAKQGSGEKLRDSHLRHTWCVCVLWSPPCCGPDVLCCAAPCPAACLPVGLMLRLYRWLVSQGRLVPREDGGFLRMQQGRMVGYKARARNDIIAKRWADICAACTCARCALARASDATHQTVCARVRARADETCTLQTARQRVETCSCLCANVCVCTCQQYTSMAWT